MSKKTYVKGPLITLKKPLKDFESDNFSVGYFGDLYRASRDIKKKLYFFLHTNNQFHEYVNGAGGNVNWNQNIPPEELHRLVTELTQILHETEKMSSKIQHFIESEMTEDGIIRGRKRADLEEEMSSAWRKLRGRAARWSVASLVIILGYSSIVYIAEKNYFGGFIKIPALHTIEKITGS